MPAPVRLARDEHFGRRLGRYELLCRLAGGGMSQIFLAYRRGAGGFRKFVVIKQILPDLRGDEDFLRMFLREAKITAALNHPHIAQVFDLGVDKGELFIVMEYVHGVTVVDIARALRSQGNRIPIGLTASVVRDTAVALHYVHSFSAPGIGQVVHRDVAEKNVMLTFDGSAKLLDFGIAKSLSSMSRTATGTVKGTPGYIAPEQIRGEPVTPRADIFSLGVVLYQCLTDVMLFQGQTPIEQMAATLSTQVQPPSRINLDVPPALDQVVLRALDRDPSRRFATALDFADAVDEACRGLSWRPAQATALLKRLFPERADDVKQMLTLVPEEPEVDLTGKAILSQLLQESTVSITGRDEAPWAELVQPAPPVIASPLVPMPPALEPETVLTGETTRREGEGAPELGPEPKTNPSDEALRPRVFDKPPVADHRETVNLRPDSGNHETARDLPTPPSVLVGAPPQKGPPPRFDDQTMEIRDLSRVQSLVKGPDALPPNVAARKAKAQKMGVMVGSAVVGGAIGIIALAGVLRAVGEGPPGAVAGPVIARQPSSAGGGGGGGGHGGGGGGGGGPPSALREKLQKPVDPAFKTGTEPLQRWDPNAFPAQQLAHREEEDANAREVDDAPNAAAPVATVKPAVAPAPAPAAPKPAAKRRR